MPTKLEVAPAPNLRAEQRKLRSEGYKVSSTVNVITAEEKVNATVTELNRKQAKYRVTLNGPKLSIWLPEKNKSKAQVTSHENEKSLLTKAGYRFSQMILLKTSIVTAEFALNSVNLSPSDYRIILNHSILEIWLKSEKAVEKPVVKVVKIVKPAIVKTTKRKTIKIKTIHSQRGKTKSR